MEDTILQSILERFAESKYIVHGAIIDNSKIIITIEENREILDATEATRIIRDIEDFYGLEPIIDIRKSQTGNVYMLLTIE